MKFKALVRVMVLQYALIRGVNPDMPTSEPKYLSSDDNTKKE